MRRYFLTGCTGWIGRYIVAELLKREDTEQIVLLTRDPQARFDFAKMDQRIIFHEGFIETCQFPEMRFTHIIHGSNESQYADPHRNYYTMVEGTNRLMRWAYESYGTVQPKMLLLSSGAAQECKTPYGQGKYLCELLMRRYTGLGRIARIYTLIGENTPTIYAAGLFYQQARDEGRITVKGGKNTERSYLHVIDAARWLIRILDDGEHDVIYDVGGAEPVTMISFASLMGYYLGVSVFHEPHDEPRNVYLPDLRPARNLGLLQNISLNAALEDLGANFVCHSNVEAPAAS